MPQNHTLVLYENFRAGEFGLANPVEYGRILRSGHEAMATVAHTGAWTGAGMTILPDGSLCPMPEPAAQATTLPALAGAAVDMGMGFVSTGPVVWIKAGNTIYQGPAYTLAACTGTSADALSYLDRVAGGFFTWAINASGTVEAINHTTGAIAALAGSPPPAVAIALYGDRMMLASSVAPFNRLYFSAAGDYTSWPAANYIDVGDASRIVALVPMRGFLAVAKSGGNDTTWWALRGVPGVNATLRPVSVFPPPLAPNNVVVANDNRAVFTAATQDPTTGFGTVPAVFDGANGQLVSLQQHFSSHIASQGALEAYRLAHGNDVLFKQSTGLLLRKGGVYESLSFQPGLQLDLTHFAANSRSMAVDPTGSTFSMLNAASDTFYAWQPYTTRPAKVTDTTGQPSTTNPTFTLPEWRSPLGSEVAVTGLVVEFRKWNTGDSQPNQFDCILSSTSPYGGGATTTVATKTFAEVASASSSLGTTARVTLSFPQQFGNGFILKFQNVRGVAIQTIAVSCELREMQGLS